MAHASLLGDLRERPDGGFDGWCWAPDRPDERLVVELLVDDTVAASIVAALFRRDLLLSGFGDGRHGFVLKLPPGSIDPAQDALITARERRSGIAFGRMLRPGLPGAIPDAPRIEAMESAVGALWQQLAQLRAANSAALPSQHLRDALGELAGRLRRRAGAASAGPDLRLPAAPDPRLSVVLRTRQEAGALTRLRALAPALAPSEAEMLALDGLADPLAARLPMRVANLRYLRAAPPAASLGWAAACNLAAARSRGARVLVLEDAPERPSAAALMAFATATRQAGPALWLGQGATRALRRLGVDAPVALRLPARLGLRICADRALLSALGPLDAAFDDGAWLDCADLALRAHLIGVPLRAVTEPEGMEPQADPDPVVSWRARAAFRARWGALDPRGIDA